MAIPAAVTARLDYWAQRQPKKELFKYLSDDGRQSASYTYEDAASQSAVLAKALLQKAGPALAAGDRILLVYLPSLDFIIAFLACLRAGLVPVPVYPPDPRRNRAYVSAFSQIAADCGAKAALSHTEYTRAVSLNAMAESAKRILSFGFRGGSAASAAGKGGDWPDLPWFNSTDLLADARKSSGSAGCSFSDAPAVATAPAFLQYTSGSTAEPKGVIITHGSLQHNLATILASLSASDDTVVVSWLPQYHDMGLIGSLLGTLYCGGSGVYMSPLSFVKRPPLWIESMAKYRATHIQSPNFGFKLAARKWREQLAAGGARAAAAAAGMSLTSVRHMFNAAEPVTIDAIADFLATFSQYGLSPAAMRPGYGLAEHTVYVSDGGSCAVLIDRASFERDAVHVLGSAKLTDEAALRALLSSPGVVASGHASAAGSGAAAGGDSDAGAAASASASASAITGSLGSAPIVSCGPVAPYSPRNADVTIVIVDTRTGAPIGVSNSGEATAAAAASGSPAPDARVGEVWLASPSCAAGYWGRAAASEEAFRARLQAPALPSSEGAAAGSAAAAVVPASAYASTDSCSSAAVAASGSAYASTEFCAGSSSDGASTGSAGGASFALALASVVVGGVDSSGAAATAPSLAASAAPAAPAPAHPLSTAGLFARFKDTPFLRTGDLGFIHNGELFICGRAKDLIIVRGRNHYPQDVEATVEGDPRIRPGCTAAFQAPVAAVGAGGAVSASATGTGSNGSAGGAEEEGVVVVAEVRDGAMRPEELAELRDALRAAVAKEHGEGLSALLLVKPHAAQKTTSGKIARKWNRRAFLAMHADAKAAWHPSTGAVLLEWRGPPPSSADDTGALTPIAGSDAGAAGAAGAAGGSIAAGAAVAAAAPSPGGAGEAGLYASTAAGGAAFEVPAAAGAPAGAPAVSAASAGAAATAVAASAGAAEPPSGPPPLMHLTGDALVASLQAHVARLLRCDPGSIMPAAALVDNGLDSMSLVQLGGALREHYGLCIKDEHLFNTGLTLHWLRDNAPALRAPYAFQRDSEAFAAAAAAVPVPPHDADAVPGGGGGAAGSAATAPMPAGAAAAGAGVGGAAAGAGAGAAAAAAGPLVVPAGPALVGLPPPRPRGGRKLTWFQKNCPCFTWCWEV